MLESMNGSYEKKIKMKETLIGRVETGSKGIDPGDKQVQHIGVVLNGSGDIGLECLVACLKTLKFQEPSGKVFGTHGPSARQSHIDGCSVHRTLCVRRRS